MRYNKKDTCCIAQIKSSQFYLTLGPKDVSFRTASIVKRRVNSRLKWLRTST